MKVFKTLGHFFATAFQAIVKETPKIEATESTVTTVTAAAGTAVGQTALGTAAVAVEEAAYAALGSVAAAIAAGGAAASSKLADAGLDVTAIQKVEAAIKAFPGIAALAKAL